MEMAQISEVLVSSSVSLAGITTKTVRWTQKLPFLAVFVPFYSFCMSFSKVACTFLKNCHFVYKKACISKCTIFAVGNCCWKSGFGLCLRHWWCWCAFQYNGQHLFVHIGNNVTYSDPVLEASVIAVCLLSE